MNVKQLHEFLTGLLNNGLGDLPVLFDTRAKSFNYHLAQIGSASYTADAGAHVVLTEAVSKDTYLGRADKAKRCIHDVVLSDHCYECGGS